jgi:hypothetical protein
MDDRILSVSSFPTLASLVINDPCNVAVQRTLPVSTNVISVTYGNGVFVVVSYGSTITSSSINLLTHFSIKSAGLLSTIDSAIANGTNEAMKIEWEYSTEIKRLG